MLEILQKVIVPVIAIFFGFCIWYFKERFYFRKEKTLILAEMEYMPIHYGKNLEVIKRLSMSESISPSLFYLKRLKVYESSIIFSEDTYRKIHNRNLARDIYYLKTHIRNRNVEVDSFCEFVSQNMGKNSMHKALIYDHYISLLLTNHQFMATECDNIYNRHRKFKMSKKEKVIEASNKKQDENFKEIISNSDFNKTYLLQKKKFVFVGMPSSGKSTIAKIYGELLDKQILNCDDYYDKILNDPSCNLAKQFYNLKFPENKNDEFIKCENGSEQFIKHYGEDLFREFEEFVNIEILTKNINTDVILDLPGKIFMNEKIRKKLLELNYLSIYLNVDKDVLVKRLSNNNSWSKRSTYRIAEENGMGWQKLFEKDYQERCDVYAKADLNYPINNNENPEFTVRKLTRLVLEN